MKKPGPHYFFKVYIPQHSLNYMMIPPAFWNHIRSESGNTISEQKEVVTENAEEHSSLSTNKEIKVVAAIDESEGSMHALEWVLDHLTFLHNNSSVTLVHAQQLFQHHIFPAAPAMYATTSVVESIKQAQEQNTSTILTAALKLCKEREVKAETLITDGEPKEAICEAAEQVNADLLVVGSRGLSKFKRAFLGSVSDYIAHHAKCPVLIVKPKK